MIRLAPSFIRLAAAGAAVALSAGALSACGSSSNSAGSTTSPSTSESMSTSVSTGASVGGVSPNITALCTGLSSADLSSLSQAKDPTTAEHAWEKLAADAPDAIKADMQTIDSYLKAAIARDYTSLSSAMPQLQTALTHIETYIATNCHA
ncbi:MAG TPA: hypothetical protein VFA96_01390 [Nocardioides sp.]|jgi:hypothetical protein|nr:hypothetical protein [Nocardioides sp.]